MRETELYALHIKYICTVPVAVVMLTSYNAEEPGDQVDDDAKTRNAHTYTCMLGHR